MLISVPSKAVVNHEVISFENEGLTIRKRTNRDGDGVVERSRYYLVLHGSSRVPEGRIVVGLERLTSHFGIVIKQLHELEELEAQRDCGSQGDDVWIEVIPLNMQYVLTGDDWQIRHTTQSTQLQLISVDPDPDEELFDRDATATIDDAAAAAQERFGRLVLAVVSQPIPGRIEPALAERSHYFELTLDGPAPAAPTFFKEKEAVSHGS